MENFEIRKPKLNKNGFHQNTNIISIKALKKLNIDLKRLEDYIENFDIYLSHKMPLEIKEKIKKKMQDSLQNLNINLEILNTSIQIN